MEPMSWEQFRELDPAAPGLRIAWGEGDLAFGDLRLPPGPGPHPVVAVVHGGCWRSIASLDYMSHVAEALTASGWATWSLEFRRVDDPGGRWPGLLRDVGMGLDHLRTLADEHPIDPDRVVALGHSSGGHLALWLAARAGLPDAPGAAVLRGSDPLRVHGVIGLAPIADLAALHAAGGEGCEESSVLDLLGGGTELDRERLHLADPASRLPLGVPQLLITGLRDDTVPAAHARAYGERARVGGDAVTIVEVEEAGHFEVVAPWAEGWTAISGEIDRFLTAVAS